MSHQGAGPSEQPIDTRQSIDTRSLPGDGNRQTYAPPDDDVKDCPDGEGDSVDLMEGNTR